MRKRGGRERRERQRGNRKKWRPSWKKRGGGGERECERDGKERR